MKKNFLTNTKFKAANGEESKLLQELAIRLSNCKGQKIYAWAKYFVCSSDGSYVMSTDDLDFKLSDNQELTIDQIRQYIAEQKVVEYAESVGWDLDKIRSHIAEEISSEEWWSLEGGICLEKTAHIIEKYKPKEPINENIGQVDDKPTLYIAGPISKIKDLNKPYFAKCAAVLRSIGYTVINPNELCEGMTADQWQECMRIAMSAMISKADIVVMLKGWQDSKGAKIERETAEKIGIKIVEFEDLIKEELL